MVMVALHSKDVHRETHDMQVAIAKAYDRIAKQHLKMAKVYAKYNWNNSEEGARRDAETAKAHAVRHAHYAKEI